MAMLLKTQNPMPRFADAWCPGGRTAQNALRMLPRMTASTAVMMAPAAVSAAVSDPGEISVSPVLSVRRPAAMSLRT